MPARDRLARLASSWHGDAVLAAVLCLVLLLSVAAQDALHGLNNLFETCCGLGLCMTIIARRGYPKQAALVAACLLLLTSVGTIGSLRAGLVFIPVFLLAYSLGTADDVGWPALVMTVLLASVQVTNGITSVNLFVPVAVIGPWALGLAVRSGRLADQLAAGRQLAARRRARK